MDIASAHHRRASMREGLQAFSMAVARSSFSAEAGGSSYGGSLVLCRRERGRLILPHGWSGSAAGGKRAAVLQVLSRWRNFAAAKRAAKKGVRVADEALTRRLLGKGMRGWRDLTRASARQTRADRAALLRGSFIALRQVRVSRNVRLFNLFDGGEMRGGGMVTFHGK